MTSWGGGGNVCLMFARISTLVHDARVRYHVTTQNTASYTHMPPLTLLGITPPTSITEFSTRRPSLAN